MEFGIFALRGNVRIGVAPYVEEVEEGGSSLICIDGLPDNPQLPAFELGGRTYLEALLARTALSAR